MKKDHTTMPAEIFNRLIERARHTNFDHNTIDIQNGMPLPTDMPEDEFIRIIMTALRTGILGLSLDSLAEAYAMLDEKHVKLTKQSFHDSLEKSDRKIAEAFSELLKHNEMPTYREIAAAMKKRNNEND